MQKFSEDWLMAFGLVMDRVATWDWLNILLLGTAFVILVLLLIAQFTRGDGFDLRSLLARRAQVSGREYWTVDPGKCYQFGGFLFTSWGFVVLIGKGALSDMYLAIYAVAWLASPGINQIVASKFPVAPGTGGTATTETTETSSTTTTVTPKAQP